MELGLFQLENLIVSRTPFCFLDLREEPVLVPEIANVIGAATPVRPDRVDERLRELGFLKEKPVILICEDGVVSRQVALSLEAQDFVNAYVVKGGVEGLLSEL